MLKLFSTMVSISLANRLSSRGMIGGGSYLDNTLLSLALSLPGVLGTHRLVLGRRKWKVAGGYPTLAHGGLTLLETLCPASGNGPIAA
jgi:hypothetical protein